VEGNLADHHRDAAALLEAVAAKAREILDAERKIQLVLHLEALLLVFRQHRVGDLHRVFRLQHKLDLRAFDLAVDAQLGALTRGDVKVRGSLLDHLLEKELEVHTLRDAAGRWRYVRYVWRSGH